MSNQILVEDLIDSAIIAGFQSGTAIFVESIEEQLQNDQLLNENDLTPAELLQIMLNEAEGEVSVTESSEHLQNLSAKMSRLFKD